VRAAPKFYVLLQLRLPLLAHRLSQHCEFPLSRCPADVRKSKKVERRRLSFVPFLSVLSGKPPKRDQARLIRMQFKTELGKSFA